MEFSLEGRSDYVEKIVKSEMSVEEGMRELIEYCRKYSMNPLWNHIKKINFESSVSEIKKWLLDVLSNHPPSSEVDGFWFGLFNPILSDEKPSCDLYISGSDCFDPNDEFGDWACDPNYFPEGRYARSKVLHKIYRLVSKDKEIKQFGEYILCLGYAGLLLKNVFEELDSDLLLGKSDLRHIAVGFDSGDFILLGKIDNSGFSSYDF